MNRTSGYDPADLLVIGGGMAGLTAGAWAARKGARVIVAERAPTLGGSAALAGFIWSTPTFEALRAVNPGGDPELGRVLVDGFADGVDWVRSVGADCGPEVTVLRYGRGHQVDTNGYIRACAEILPAAGAKVLTGARVRPGRGPDSPGSPVTAGFAPCDGPVVNLVRAVEDPHGASRRVQFGQHEVL